MNGNDEYGFSLLHQKLLEIIRDIDTVCRNNGIVYYIMGGTALGAVRHGGFIPWDDDLDIMMTPENYYKFKSCFNSLPKEKYHLQEWGRIEDMIALAKVRMNNTTYLQEHWKNKLIHHGILIDIIILHNVPNNLHRRYIQYMWSKYITAKRASNRKETKGGKLIQFLLRVFRVFPKDFLLKYAMKQIYKYNDRSTDFCGQFFINFPFKKSVYPKKMFDNPQSIKFDKLILPAPSDVIGYLTIYFGDFMRIPSKNQILKNLHVDFYDIQNDYTKYLSIEPGYENIDDLNF